MDQARAQRLIMFTVWFNTVAAGVALAGGWLTGLVGFDIHLFLPWLIAGYVALPMLVILGALTYLLWRKSRTAAILLLVLYLLNRFFTLIWLYVYPPAFIIAWAVVALAWVAGFVPGIVGTFAWHRAQKRGAATGAPLGTAPLGTE